MNKFDIIQFFVEKVLDAWMERLHLQYDRLNIKKDISNYINHLEEKLLSKYQDTEVYEELFRILNENNALEKIVAFGQDYDNLGELMTQQQLVDEMTCRCSNLYIKSQVKSILEDLIADTFNYFNMIQNEDIFKLKNYLERETHNLRRIIEKQRNDQLELSKILNNIENKQIKKKEATEITLGCPKPIAHFCGREKEIEEVEKVVTEHLNENRRLAYWIFGMGGLGKTQICRALYLKLKESFGYIGWISYQDDFKVSLIKALNLNILEKSQESIEEAYQRALQYLRNLGKEALIFIDNYNNIDDCLMDIERLSCHVIISSRSNNPDMFLGMKLGFLSLKNCKKIFRRFYTVEYNDIMNEIIHLSGYLTIAVELLAKTAEIQAISLLELYEILRDKEFDIHTVIRSNWDNTSECLEEELTRHFEIIFDITPINQNPQKVNLLQNFSLLPYLGINQKEIMKWLGLNRETNLLFDLYNAGWLEKSENQEYSMHPLISYTVRKYNSPTLKDCFQLVSSMSEQIHITEGDNYVELFFYLPYADSVGKYFRNRNTESDLILGRLFCELATIYAANGEYGNAYSWGEAAGFQMESINDCKEKTVLLNVLFNAMAEICLDMRNRNEECKEWAEKAVQHDEKHPDTISKLQISNSFHNLGCAYIQLRDNKKALQYETLALNIRKKYLKDSHVKLLNVQRNLAMIYRRQGQIQEAFEMQWAVVRCLFKLHHDNLYHPDFPVAYSLYSFILRDQKKLQAAICYQKAAARVREHNNDKDPKLAINYNNLGVFEREYGNLCEAEEWQKRAIETDLRLRGPDHIDLATDYYNYALILREKKEFKEALRYLEECLRIEKLAETDDTKYIDDQKEEIYKLMRA